MEIRLGTQGWSYPDWVGPFYAPGSRQAEFLVQYARVFDTVELDSTFYGAPRPTQVRAWAENTPATFVFSAKLPRAITHDRRLVDCAVELEHFVEAMSELGPKLGPLLIQLPPSFAIDERPALEEFLKLLPAGYQFAAEFRHRSWLGPETHELLAEHGVAWTIVDLPYLPRTPEATAPFSYVRWLGDRRELSRYDEIQIDRTERDDEWAAVLLGLGVERIYGYYNNHYAGHSPASVREMQRRLGLPVREPPPPNQPSLFDLS